MSNNAENNLEDFEISLEEFAAGKLPSLDDLARELEQVDLEEQSQTIPIIEYAAVAHTGKSVSEAELTEAKREVTRLEQEKIELQTAYARVRSDLDKFRWRAERERSEHYAFAVMSVVRELLPVLDNFNRAITTARDANIRTEIEFSQFLNGVDLIGQQIHKFLADMGVQPIEAVGVAFDPQIHEAAALEENSQLPPNTIIEEILRGYRLGERLVRPSLVKVSKNNDE